MPEIRGAAEHNKDIKKMREFMSEYKVVTTEQFDRYLNKEPRICNIIRNRMVRNDTLFVIDGMCSVKPDWMHYYDRAMIRAVWVMLDLCENPEHNMSADYPSKLRFSKDGEVYDVCVIEEGKENTVNVFYNKFSDEIGKYLVVVDKKEQIPKINFEGIVAFCIVDEDGKIRYYRNGE